jgi:hypothetical protein
MVLSMKYNEIMSITNLSGKFARSTEEEREQYRNVRVHVTEKIHGENFRIGIIDGRRVIGSRKELFYWDEIANNFIHEFTHKQHSNWEKINQETKDSFAYVFNILEGMSEEFKVNVVFYGELYGNGLQKGFTYNHDGYSVIYYELAVNNKYIDFEDVLKVCILSYVRPVPYFGSMTLQEFLDMDVESIHSQVANEPYIEGLVAIPVSGEYKWDFDDRFAIKRKTKQFDETRSAKPERKKGTKYVSPFEIHVTVERMGHVIHELKEEGVEYSHESSFRMLAVNRMVDNIRDEENEGIEFDNSDRRSLTTEGHKIFSEYATRELNK